MRSICWRVLLAAFVLFAYASCATCAEKKEAASTAKELVASLERHEIPGLQRKAIGVTRAKTSLFAFVSPEDLDFSTKKIRITLVGGMDGNAESVRTTLAALRIFQTADLAKSLRERILLSAVACVNPDGIASDKGTKNTSGGDPSGGYPPRGPSYNSSTDPESAYVWRWLGMHAPDLVVELRAGESLAWGIPSTGDAWETELRDSVPGPKQILEADSLVAQIVKNSPSGTGKISALRVTAPADSLAEAFPPLLAKLAESQLAVPSPARAELRKRSQRSPLDVARQLTKTYGHDLGRVEYIPALALVGRLRVGELTNDASHRDDVERIVSPYVRGDKATTPTSGSGLSGHLIFSELARISSGEKKARYVDLVQVAANMMFDNDGEMKTVMPFHTAMSDALFMGGPILAAASKLTGKKKYADGCVQHLRFMRKLVQREDRLYRHSPLDEAAWGRGNGFPALGLALVLSDLPTDHPDRAELMAMFQGHLEALAKFQDSTGSWHQVIDHEESYREFTCTCMIGFSMIRGMRNGWFEPAKFDENVNRAWRAIQARIDENGGLVDVCTGTGKQKSLRDYYDREATLGKDARGGAMALMFTTELVAWENEKKTKSR